MSQTPPDCPGAKQLCERFPSSFSKPTEHSFNLEGDDLSESDDFDHLKNGMRMQIQMQNGMIVNHKEKDRFELDILNHEDDPTENDESLNENDLEKEEEKEAKEKKATEGLESKEDDVEAMSASSLKPFNNSWYEQSEDEAENLDVMMNTRHDEEPTIESLLAINKEQKELLLAADMVGLSKISQLMKSAIAEAVMSAMKEQVAVQIKQAVKDAVTPLHIKIDQLCCKLDARIQQQQQGQDHFPLLQPPQSSTILPPVWPSRRYQPGSGQARPHPPIAHLNSNREDLDVTEAFAMARRCVGLFPITAEDIDRHNPPREDGSKSSSNFQEAGVASVRTFLKSVLKIASDTADNLSIKGVFYQGRGAISNTLYVELNHHNDLATVRNAAANIINTDENNPKLIQYIPVILKPQYNAILNLAYEGRTATAVRKASKIWTKSHNFELRFKAKGDPTPWSAIEPEDIPALLEAQKAKAAGVTALKLRAKRPTPPSHSNKDIRVEPINPQLSLEEHEQEEPLVTYNISTNNKFGAFQQAHQFPLH